MRTIILFVALIATLRLMGKRQLGELQPFEFAVMLVVAELACIPMQDVTIPVTYGIIAMIAVFCMHYLITFVSSKSIKFRKLINGKPVIVINEAGIDAAALKGLNLNVHDILESIRGQGYFGIEEIKFGIVETNGKLSILPNDGAERPQSIPLTMIVEGRYIDANLHACGIDKSKVESYLRAKSLPARSVLLMTAESGKYFVQPVGKPYFVDKEAGNEA